MTSQEVALQAQQHAAAQYQAIDAAASAITEQQAFIIQAFRGQIYISDTLDVQDTPLYDTVTYTPSQQVNNANSAFFTNVAGNSGKTLAQTNLIQNGVMEAPEAFAVFGVRLGFSEGVLRSDLQALLDGCFYQLVLGKKAYQQGNIRHYSSGWGIAGFSSKTGESVYTNGFQSPGAMNLLAIKLVIANQMTFKANLDGFSSGSITLSANGSGLILLNEFVGLYARGVQ